MKRRQFEMAKSVRHPSIVYCLHGDGKGRVIALGRDYKPVGVNTALHVDYAAPAFAHLRVTLTPLLADHLRCIAVSVNEWGDTSLYGGPGSPVPIFQVLGPRDRISTYCARLMEIQALQKYV